MRTDGIRRLLQSEVSDGPTPATGCADAYLARATAVVVPSGSSMISNSSTGVSS
jgi:hypothetical protein